MVDHFIVASAPTVFVPRESPTRRQSQRPWLSRRVLSHELRNEMAELSSSRGTRRASHGRGSSLTLAKNVNPTYVHEAGHLVIGHRIGVFEQGITFIRGGDEAAQAIFTLSTPIRNLRRALAGVLAQLELVPESIEPSEVRDAFQVSVILDSFHPHYARVSADERVFASGARDDLRWATQIAISRVGDDPERVSKLLRRHEKYVRNLVRKNRDAIVAIVTDIEVWAQEDIALERPTCFYSGVRAKEVIEPKG
jgi:hypothetical protein